MNEQWKWPRINCSDEGSDDGDHAETRCTNDGETCPPATTEQATVYCAANIASSMRANRWNGSNVENLFRVQEDKHAFAQGLLQFGEEQGEESGMDQKEESPGPWEGEQATKEEQQIQEARIGWTGDMEGSGENAEENGRNK